MTESLRIKPIIGEFKKVFESDSAVPGEVDSKATTKNMPPAFSKSSYPKYINTSGHDNFTSLYDLTIFDNPIHSGYNIYL